MVANLFLKLAIPENMCDDNVESYLIRVTGSKIKWVWVSDNLAKCRINNQNYFKDAPSASISDTIHSILIMSSSININI